MDGKEVPVVKYLLDLIGRLTVSNYQKHIWVKKWAILFTTPAYFSHITIPSTVYDSLITCYVTCCSPSSFILLIRPSHTNFDDKDENPTLASLTIFPQCAPFFWQRSSLVICISVYVPASMLCTALSPAWPSYWCLCCGGHLERCPAAAHEHCPYPSSPYSSAWRGCQPRLLSLPGWAMVSNCQCLCTSSAEGDMVFRRAAKLTHVFIFSKWQAVILTRVSYLPKSRLRSIYANKLVAVTGFLAKEIRFVKKR